MSDYERKNPHNWTSRITKGVDNWICHYCNKTGSFDDLNLIECDYVYPECEYCGKAPECAIDCKGVLSAFQGAIDCPEVCVSGIDPEDGDTIN